MIYYEENGLKLTKEQYQTVHDVVSEYTKAISKYPPMNSAHEGYAVLLEEVDELWDHVKTNEKKRDLDAMKQEAIQIAAMALRFANECCNKKEFEQKSDNKTRKQIEWCVWIHDLDTQFPPALNHTMNFLKEKYYNVGYSVRETIELLQ